MKWKLLILLCAFYFNWESINGLQNGVTVVIGNSSATNTISIGYIMDQLTPPYRIGAMQLAIQDGQAKGLLRNFNFRLYICFFKTSAEI
jgi:hypothetical protein